MPEGYEARFKKAEMIVAEHDGVDVEDRNKCLRQIEEQFASATRVHNPQVFISCNGDLGGRLLPQTERYFRQLPKFDGLPSSGNFRVKSGFKIKNGRRGAGGESDVINFLVRTIKNSALFVGIVVAEHKEFEGEGTPGPWPMFEAGIAESYGLPVVLLVHSDVSESYWQKIYGMRRMVKFSEESYSVALQHCGAHVQNNYAELQES